ncbi:MAG: hypothetical protein CR986_09020 [Ignavibacteriae bacterium]|nr:MAG: hypothetical protein CR986_09020 [Ignavibacteriota bacterium]
MKRLLLLIVFIPILLLEAQQIGNVIVEKPHKVFPDNSLGVNLIIGESGFGLGGFYNYKLVNKLTGFIDLSITESKDTREIQRYNYFGQLIVVSEKKNRIFPIPLNFGLQYRIFSESLTDNLRPYISASIGPTMFITTPAAKEFFSAFADTKLYWGLSGYVGFGANFGLTSDNLTGICIRYYYHQLFNDGLEQNYNEYKKNIQSIALTINIGVMY